MATTPETAVAGAVDRDSILREIQERVLWLAVYMVDYANNTRPSSGDLKIGGHQASSSSVVTVADVPLLRVHARRRPHRHQAACVARLPRDTVPARQPGARVPGLAALAPRAAGVPEPDEGPGRRRLLGGPGRTGRGRPQLRVADRDVRPRPARRGRRGRAALHQPAGRRRAGRRGRVGGDRRPRRRRGREHPVGHRPQPPEPRPRHPRHPRPGVAGDVRGQRLDGDRRQVRQAAPGRLPRAERRAAARRHRRHVQRHVPAAAQGRRPGRPRVDAPRQPLPGRPAPPAVAVGRRAARGAADEPWGPRLRGAARRLRPRRPGGGAEHTLRLHAEGLEASVHRRPPEPRRHDEQGADGEAARRAGRRQERRAGAPRPVERRRTRGQRGRGAAAGRRRGAAEHPVPGDTGRLRPRLPRRHVVAADIRPRAHRHLQEHPGRVRARRHRQPGRRELDQPGRAGSTRSGSGRATSGRSCPSTTAPGRCSGSSRTRVSTSSWASRRTTCS